MTDRPLDFQTLEFIHSRKTGALFIASAELGAAAARAAPAERAAVGSYAKNLGLAFQIVDDLIDAVGASAEAGQRRGQGPQEDDLRLVLRSGRRPPARGGADRGQRRRLAGFGAKAQPLRELARYVVTRRR